MAYAIGSGIDDSPRGCGNLVEGGYYASGGGTGEGVLSAWTWTCGSLHYGQPTVFQKPDINGEVTLPHNYHVEAAPRSKELIDLRRSLLFGEAWKDKTELNDEKPFESYIALQQLPPVALLDHVGAQHYTIYGFASETSTRGPNRRISPDLAYALAQAQLPLPILFTHSHVPVAESPDAYKRMIEQAYIETKNLDAFQATWNYVNMASPSHTFDAWGPYAWQDSHWDRAFVLVMQWLDANTGQPNKGPMIDIPGVQFRESAIGISWITQAIRVMESSKVLDDYAEDIDHGIIPVFPQGQKEAI